MTIEIDSRDSEPAMAALPKEHRQYLERKPFPIDVAPGIFPADELLALTERGYWMEALASGAIQPATAAHKHFLLVDRDEAEPKTVDERAWARLKGRREYEREQQQAPPPPEPEDYGMIEWDKEKCWW